MSAAGDPRTVRAVVLSVEDVLVPFRSVRAWQWAWRPQGPLLAERHAATAIRRSLRQWDRRRWLGAVGRAPPTDLGALHEHLGEALRAIAGHAVASDESDAVIRRLLHPTGEVERFPDVAPLLGRLGAAGTRVGAVSALPGESARWLIRRVGLDEQLLVASGDGSAPTLPARAAYGALADRLGVPAPELVLVGGLYWSDVRAAMRAGVPALLLDRAGAWPHVGAGRFTALDAIDLSASRTGGDPGEGPRADGADAAIGDRPSGDFL